MLHKPMEPHQQADFLARELEQEHPRFRREDIEFALLLAGVCAQEPARPPPPPPPPPPAAERPHRPNLLERIGRFFYHVSDSIERSDRAPDFPPPASRAPARRSRSSGAKEALQSSAD